MHVCNKQFRIYELPNNVWVILEYVNWRKKVGHELTSVYIIIFACEIERLFFMAYCSHCLNAK